MVVEGLVGYVHLMQSVKMESVWRYANPTVRGSNVGMMDVAVHVVNALVEHFVAMGNAYKTASPTAWEKSAETMVAVVCVEHVNLATLVRMGCVYQDVFQTA